MVLSTEWSQVEVIDLLNDGTGLGFGIVGGRSTGVVIKSILPGGIADRDGRAQSGDHILQIGDVNLRGLGSDQVATVLRNAGAQVRMVVARSVEPTSADFQMVESEAPIVPTKILIDPEELDRHLLQNGYEEQYDKETECFTVTLEKNIHGLGITVAGYVCEREDLSGIFIKSISEGSAADRCKKICGNDRIVAVDGEGLQGFTNHEAVEKLRNTGSSVTLCLERYLRGPKYEHLQEALAQQETRSIRSISPQSVKTLSWFPVESEPESVTSAEKEIFIDANYEADLTDELEHAIKKKWQNIIGTDSANIVVAHLTKLKGLGISLEGTVDVEDGVELRPHHYIRSILPEGPVGQTGKLSSGDELLEVNGQRLIGIKHVEVVKILKELPSPVRLVCSRTDAPSRVINTSQDVEAFAQRSILGNYPLKDLPSPKDAPSRVINTSQNVEGFAQRSILGNYPLKDLPSPVEVQRSIGNYSTPIDLPNPEDAPSRVINASQVVEAFGQRSILGNYPLKDLPSPIEVQRSIGNYSTPIDLPSPEDAPSRVINNASQDVEAFGQRSILGNYPLKNLPSLTKVQRSIGNYSKPNPLDLPSAKDAPSRVINGSQVVEAFAQRSILGNFPLKDVEASAQQQRNYPIKVPLDVASTQRNSNFPVAIPNLGQVLVKAVSDSSINTSSTATISKSNPLCRSHSMENASLATWCETPTIIDLKKGERGLGFSILDYQDPLDPKLTVIVVRSLVPNGPAEMDGRLKPGDRLMSVNGIGLKNATLDRAVQVLKATTPGVVLIGVAKPLPTSASSTNTIAS